MNNLNNFNEKEDLTIQLEYADWGIEHKSFNADNLLNYIVASLKRGTLAKPAGFKSRAERMAEEAVAYAERVKQLRGQAADIAFENMLADPDGDLYQKCLASVPPIHKKKKARHSI